MDRDEQEMALWREAYLISRMADRASREAEAGAAVEAFRRRFPPQSSAPEAVWYDEPPFPKDGIERPCWIAGYGKPYMGEVYWFDREWRMCVPGDGNVHPLAGRRVCPIVKPQEPTP